MIIVSVHDITNKILSRDSNSTVDLLMWPRFGNSSIYMRDVIITSILEGSDQKNHYFLRGGLGSSSIIWDGTRYGLEILHQCDKRIKTKSKRAVGANSYICRSYRGKLNRVITSVMSIYWLTLTISWRRSLICSENQWTGFYMTIWQGPPSQKT